MGKRKVTSRRKPMAILSPSQLSGRRLVSAMIVQSNQFGNNVPKGFSGASARKVLIYFLALGRMPYV
jgi:hypothetical protein